MAQDKPDHDGCDKPILIYTTFPTAQLAEEVAAALVDRKLIACANIIPGMVAIYAWQGERLRDGEVAVILKTRAALVEPVFAAVKALHPFENPALIAVTPAACASAYRDWILEQTAMPQLEAL